MSINIEHPALVALLCGADYARARSAIPALEALIAERDALLVTRDELTEALVRLTKEAAALCDALKAARGES